MPWPSTNGLQFGQGLPGMAQDSAAFSPCERYRYWLSRELGNPRRRVCWVMLNPSDATATKPDPTITRCIDFTRAWGFGALDVVNLFAIRSPKPKAIGEAISLAGGDLKGAIGQDNDAWIRCKARGANRVVIAWGNHGKIGGRALHVMTILGSAGVMPLLFRMTDQGQPEHPLYQRADAKLYGLNGVAVT